MGISERKERDRAEMQRLIIEAAKELFISTGYENVSIRGIAEKIEYSPATIYLYFKDKDEILFAIHNQGFDKLYELQQTTASIADPLERLKKGGEVYIRFGLENPEYYDLMFILRAPAKVIAAKHEWEKGNRSYDYLRENVRQCMETGQMPKGDVEVATFALWSFVHGIVSLIVRDRCVMIPAEAYGQITASALDYVMSSIERVPVNA